MISDFAKKNFETLKQAFINDDVAIMEVRDTNSGEIYDALCAVGVEDDLQEGPVYTFTPFAVMFRDNPFTRLEPTEDLKNGLEPKATPA